MITVTDVVPKIQALPQDWHGAGSVGRKVLQAIATYCGQLPQRIQSVETGAGRTTLLFSHLFERHLVFAIDGGGSLTKVRQSELLRAEHVGFVEGSTQITLPATELPKSIDCALIDGPHGYPFPDLEYYYLYPRLARGGLLIIDDINIPTIRRMYDILRQDDMYKLLEVVETTAFLQRTHSPMINPLADDWWLQGFNRRAYNAILRRRRLVDTKLGQMLRAARNRLRG